MLRISRDKYTYEFSAATAPVATVNPGEPFVVETHDTSTGRIHCAEDVTIFHPHIVFADRLDCGQTHGPDTRAVEARTVPRGIPFREEEKQLRQTARALG